MRVMADHYVLGVGVGEMGKENMGVRVGYLGM